MLAAEDEADATFLPTINVVKYKTLLRMNLMKCSQLLSELLEQALVLLGQLDTFI